MATVTPETKKTMLRAALLNMDQKGELGRIANATGISGGIETLREMINDPSKIGIMDIGMIGMHFGIDL
ncbi:MAG: hypothetical protein ACXWUC_06950 [Methylosarcina sp.]